MICTNSKLLIAILILFTSCGVEYDLINNEYDIRSENGPIALDSFYYNHISVIKGDSFFNDFSRFRIEGNNVDVRNFAGHTYVRVIPSSENPELGIVADGETVKKYKVKVIPTKSLPYIYTTHAIDFNAKSFMGAVRLDSLICRPAIRNKFTFGIPFKVTSYNLEIEKEGKIVYDKSIVGNQFDTLVKQINGTLMSDYEFKFSNIKVVDDIGNVITVKKVLIKKGRFEQVNY